MVVLLDGYVVVPEGAVGPGVNVEAIGETVVAQVVADTCSQEGHYVNAVQVDQGREATLGQEEVSHVGHVDTVEVVVVLDGSDVGLLDTGQEEGQFLLVDDIDQVMLEEHVHGHKWQGRGTADKARKVENVEFTTVEMLISQDCFYFLVLVV